MLKQILLSVIATGTLSLSAATVSFSPTSQSIATGSTTTVDVQVSGLTAGQVVGAFDLTVVSDSSIVTATNVTFLGSLGSPASELTASTLTSGQTEAAEISNETTATLQGLQTSSNIALFRITYQGISAGTSMLSLLNSPEVLADGTGALIPITSSGTGSITVTGTSIVPEPSTAGLFAASLALVSFRCLRRKRIHASA